MQTKTVKTGIVATCEVRVLNFEIDRRKDIVLKEFDREVSKIDFSASVDGNSNRTYTSKYEYFNIKRQQITKRQAEEADIYYLRYKLIGKDKNDN